MYRATRGEEHHVVERAATRLRFSRDTGTRAPYSDAMPYARFLRSATCRAHVREIVGEPLLHALLADARKRAGQPD